MAADLHVALDVRQPLAGGDQELRFHEVDARDQLGDRMLHLDARVHLDEVELVILIEKLQSPGTAIAHRLAGFHTAISHDAPLARGDSGSGSFFDHFLVAALHRAVSLSQVNHIALAVRQHLEFDVPRAFEKFLHVDLVVGERRPSFGPCDSNGVEQ